MANLILAMAVGAALVLPLFLCTLRRDGMNGQSQQVPFLGGGSQSAHAWQRFHIRYYPMTLLFIAFEMEMMFMYPWAVVYVETGIKALAEMGMFLSILGVGIIYAWREGVFRWQ
ncbi:NADH-quinone oxidoreductase subunit A [Novosphingobium sp. PC22D]|uniref:NADH-quinone oxidoreductase subunit A n=1 Tax=Novosphingobium sp. PC22D TaxID=1962403 RepID=UPI00197CCC36|nr:NADH-quinone oxidoreductase subunit A [Novosphingobium sp. PC22D]